jgi:predicted CoA-binding protein
MVDAQRILENARSILLVDWPNPDVPRKLLAAGFDVICYSPKRYSRAQLVPDRPTDVADKDVISPAEGQSGYLVFRQLEGAPAAVDIVCAYRPAGELPGIIERQVLPLSAKALWLYPPATSSEARDLANQHGFSLVEGVDIREMVQGTIAG